RAASSGWNWGRVRPATAPPSSRPTPGSCSRPATGRHWPRCRSRPSGARLRPGWAKARPPRRPRCRPRSASWPAWAKRCRNGSGSWPGPGPKPASTQVSPRPRPGRGKRCCRAWTRPSPRCSRPAAGAGRASGVGKPAPPAAPAAPAPDDWHALEPGEALARLGVDGDGLAPDEAARRLGQYRANALPPPPRVPGWRRLLRQFNDPLILFLLAAAVLSALLGHYADAGVIAAVVLVNAIVGVVQEGRAEQALSALRSMLAPTARVLRGGHRATVPVADLVPGDVLLLEAGDRVPADARLLRARGLRVDESVLTGESVPVDKQVDPVAPDAELAARTSMLHSGTLVATGQAVALAVATGPRSRIGRIGALLGGIEPLETPLLRQIRRFGRSFTVAALVAALALFLFALAVRGYAWLDALMVVVALAVGVVPESLPAVITITLALGVRRMAARHAIVRRLPAVETLGATTVICSDKTGTLT